MTAPAAALLRASEQIGDDILGLLAAVGRKLRRFYDYDAQPPYAGEQVWWLPVGPAFVGIRLVDEYDLDGHLVCFRWVLRLSDAERVVGMGLWHPIEHIQRYWTEFARQAPEFTTLTVAALARATRCTRCGWQESECHNHRVKTDLNCCIECHHPLTFRRNP